MPTGTVRFYNVRGGFGVIQPDDGGADAFVHSSAVADSGLTELQHSQHVTYVLHTDARGQSCAQEIVPDV